MFRLVWASCFLLAEFLGENQFCAAFVCTATVCNAACLSQDTLEIEIFFLGGGSW